MNRKHITENGNGQDVAETLMEEVETGLRNPLGLSSWVIPTIALMWSLYQMLQLAFPKFFAPTFIYPRAIHLAFALTLAYLCFPTLKYVKQGSALGFLSVKNKFHLIDVALAGLACFAAIYYLVDYEAISARSGLPNTADIVMSIVLLLLLLEAARRTLGPALPVIAIFFIAYTFLAPYMPSFLAFKGASLNQFLSQVALSTEGIFGVPLDVSANTVFLFVLFGALLEKAGGGRYFVDLALSLMGGYRGGPAKASIFASATNGMISGSSIANTVVTGTFTIPLMKKVGFPSYKAGAVEVAASTNGQLTPPIMGAAAFLISDFTNLPFQQVVIAAFIPAIVSYIGLFYIVHLEASKLGIAGIPKDQRPQLIKTLLSGVHYFIPIIFLIYHLMVLRHSPKLSAFNAILVLMVITVIQELVKKDGIHKTYASRFFYSVQLILSGLVSGARNMVGIGVATAAAGIIVAVVTLGLGGLINDIVAFLAGDSLILLLIIVAIASLILGMGLPTTANYIVMAALTAPVIIELGQEMGLIVPLIAAHLFVFYFGILADDTPPVGLAAYAAAAIAKSDPIKTGVQGFSYDIRTAILPFVFIFNTDLLLIGVDSIPQGILIFVMTALGMLAFTSAIQRWMCIKNNWLETSLCLVAALILFRPDIIADMLNLGHKYYGYIIGVIIYMAIYSIQRMRKTRLEASLS